MRLDYNKLYMFRYKAIGEGQLHVYDKTPLMFILDIRPTSLLGINLHWIPPRKRTEFFEKIQEIMKKTHMVHKKRERMRLTYKLLQEPAYRDGLVAIRMYYLAGITAIKVIPEASYPIIFKVKAAFRMRKVYKSRDYKGQ